MGEIPFYVTKTEVACPFNDGVMLPIEIGWVIPEAPTLHLKAPELVEHLREKHGAT